MPPRASRICPRTVLTLDTKARHGLMRLPPASAFTVPLSPPTRRRLVGRASQTQCIAAQRRGFSSAAACTQEAEPPVLVQDVTPTIKEPAPAASAKPARQLPLQCPGCGAFSQTTQADEPGFFDVKRQSTREYLGLIDHRPRIRPEDQVVEDALRRIELAEGNLHTHLGNLLRRREDKGDADGNAHSVTQSPAILCVRCHDLVHHHAGTPIYHPDIDSLRETMDESPYKYHHVYHVIDAADFPMSLLPRINSLLGAVPLRSRNRRSRQAKFFGDRLTELSFVITRADLFAPRKDQVDKLMPWIRETLRDALGRSGRQVRLGNVRCVSARRGWRTADLKEEIWQRGGANWLVGKANVGKSYLVQHVFPKGRMDRVDDKNGKKKQPLASRAHAGGRWREALPPPQQELRGEAAVVLGGDGEANLDGVALLPPRPPETNYPQMPVVSALPGTTASPIRIPFGGGRGELVDLPGLERTGLTDYVQDDHRDALVMKMRRLPEQVVLKGPWQSLLLGGFIRITPRTPDVVFLTYNFTPLHEHRTMTDKAVAIQAQTSELNVENIAVAGTGDKTKLAGSFALKYDITKQRAGPITRKEAANIQVERLPYRVVGLDLLIEGCGWVEIVAQVRTRQLFNEDRPWAARTAEKAEKTIGADDTSELLRTLDLSDPDEHHVDDADAEATEAGDEGEAPGGDDGEPRWPIVDVYSPEGKFVGARRPLNAWLLAQPKASTKRKSLRARPKKSMKGVKRQQKKERRALA